MKHMKSGYTPQVDKCKQHDAAFFKSKTSVAIYDDLCVDFVANSVHFVSQLQHFMCQVAFYSDKIDRSSEPNRSNDVQSQCRSERGQTERHFLFHIWKFFTVACVQSVFRAI